MSASLSISQLPHIPKAGLFRRIAVMAGLGLMLLRGGALMAEERTIFDAEGLRLAVREAEAGDTLLLAPGDYALEGKKIKASASGTPESPITVRAETRGTVTLNARMMTVFHVTGANWVFENLDINGTCPRHGWCDHAIHLSGNADGVVIRDNRLRNFNAAIKGNGEIIDGQQVFPDDVVIAGNVMINESPRETRKSVTVVDVVGGRRWILRDNMIADFAKTEGNRVSYAAFFKGNSYDGVMERNLVMCEWKHRGSTRLGLSLGGGGTTNPDFCEGRLCRIEHTRGIIRNNVIMNCPNDVGIYLNNAANSQILHNTILNTRGVDVRFNGSFATIANNVITGRIKNRDGGRHRAFANSMLDDPGLLFEEWQNLNFTPVDQGRLKNTDRRFPGRAFCSGTETNSFRGAFRLPISCSPEARLNKW
ncbi:chondroitinase-B domain-containing protein [Yunchengibacter salinarum]|uniref:chondroitinase-B domain-containing protein n=1 Tax=Yunchengibacter salinarum TaxID=3133399 RepID=UPI0035B650D1